MPVQLENPPAAMSLTDLAICIHREMDRYRRKEPSSDEFCIELLKRALIQGEDDAWMLWQRIMGSFVRLWFRSHSHRTAALRVEPEEQTFIDDTFTRFWRATREQKIGFKTVAAALNYLHRCLHCAIMDMIRAHTRPREEQLPEFGFTGDFLFEDSYHQTEVWEVIEQLLATNREKRVAYLHFFCNLKPREIVHFCPDEFRNEYEIYQLKRTMMERLLRHADLIKWKLSEGE